MSRSKDSSGYFVHLRDDGPGRARLMAEADSFIDAAVKFAETAHLPHGEVSIVVSERETGRHCCFLIHTDSGQIEAC